MGEGNADAIALKISLCIKYAYTIPKSPELDTKKLTERMCVKGSTFIYMYVCTSVLSLNWMNKCIQINQETVDEA